MKRINRLLIPLIILILCTGCSIDYNIEITKDSVNETIKITDLVKDNRTKEDMLETYELWIPAYMDNNFGTDEEHEANEKNDNFEYHEKNIQELDNGYYYTYKFNYPLNKFNDSSTIREAYSKKKFYVGSDYITIKTDSNNLLCNYSYFDELKVTISVDKEIYKIKDNNADQVIDNKYIWNLNRSNCNDSEIILTLDMIAENINTPGTSDNTNDDNKQEYILYLFLGLLLILVLIGYYIFKKMKEKSEKFDIDE